jgi:endonuclease-3 related protein
MVGAVLTQNTAWTNVEKAITALKAAALLDAERITTAPHDRLAAWLRPSGYFNVKAERLRNLCAWYLRAGGYEQLREWDSARLREGLLSITGVGYETADDILLYAFERPVFVIDAYTRRLLGRLEIVDATAGYEVLRGQIEADLQHAARGPEPFPRGLVALYNEFHALIVRHGKDFCRKRPRCDDCCLRRQCRY